ncbi:MAG: hypothetical protein EA409_13745 [Saprospirales bacterium]|nr:MAG: hypothetical protein EA409_13745 [Saprospirales bacterium]
MFLNDWNSFFTSPQSNPYWIDSYLEFPFTFCLDASINSAQVLRKAQHKSLDKLSTSAKSNKNIMAVKCLAIGCTLLQNLLNSQTVIAFRHSQILTHFS